MNNNLLKITGILEEIKIITKNQYELYNTKILIKDTSFDKHGNKITNSSDKIQISYNNYIQTRINEIMILLKLYAKESLEENQKASSYFVKKSNRNQKELQKILSLIEKY